MRVHGWLHKSCKDSHANFQFTKDDRLHKMMQGNLAQSTSPPVMCRSSRRKSCVSVTDTNHPFITMFKDNVPAPGPVDQFAPYLSAKLAQKKTKVTRSQSTKKQQIPSQMSSRFMITAGSRPPSMNTSINLHQERTSSVFQSVGYRTHLEMEKTFDTIASRAMDTALSELIEDLFKKYFDADVVYYYHDVETVQILYCPSNGGVCPHGAGIVGYTQFVRKSQRILVAKEHVSYSVPYDGRYHDADARIMTFPIFDHQNHVQGIVEMIRSCEKDPFVEMDERAAEYFQEKFKLYAKWIFQPVLADIEITGIMQIQRVAAFIGTISSRLCRIFGCKAAEIWVYEQDKNEISCYTEKAGTPTRITKQDSGVAGYALINSCCISLTSVNLHAAYAQKGDGNGDWSVLVIPVCDPDNAKVYGIVLRGKRLPTFFTGIDEKILAKLAPLVISALKSCEVIERSYENVEQSNRAQKRLQSLLEVAETLSGQLHINTLIPSIMSRACELVKADRCSLFMVSEMRDKLISTFTGGLNNSIEIPINAGIVGFTATTGKVLNIKDAYEDPRFNRGTDLATGYRTQSLLCVPIADEKGTIRGVTEMINKIGGTFTDEDEKIIQVFNIFVGISIENARLYRASIDLSLQLRSVLQISQSITKVTTIKSLLEEILRNSRKVIGAGRAMIFLLNASGKDFDVFALDEDIEAKMDRVDRANKRAVDGMKSAKKALIQRMMTGGKISTDEEKTHQAEEDRQRNDAVAEVIKTRSSLLCNSETVPEDSLMVVPVFDNDYKVIGAMLMQWKKKESGFLADDLKLLESFSVFIAISLERSRMKAVAMYGSMELQMREVMSDTERQLLSIPKSMKLGKGDGALIVSRDFPVHDFQEIDPEFMKVGFFIFDKCNLRKPFKITSEKLFCFLYTMRRTYNKVPYHNWSHAIDVTCFMAHMLCKGDLLDVFKPFEVLALIVASLCHDAGHDGFSNDYNVKTQTPLGILFKNQSVMETHHCTVAINTITKDECNIFSSLDTAECNRMWQTVISLILATDMAKHFDIMKQLNDLKEQGNWQETEDGRLLIMQLLLKAADISNVARRFELADRWCDVLCEEFFRQGELEKANGLEYSTPMMKRDTLNKEKSQIGFYNSVCLPLFHEVATFIPPLRNCYDQIKSNLVIWTKRANESEKE